MKVDSWANIPAPVRDGIHTMSRILNSTIDKITSVTQNIKMMDKELKVR